MTPGASEPFALDSKDYPTGDAVYFRAVSTFGTRVPDFSNIIGPFKLVQATPPTVTINPPRPLPRQLATARLSRNQSIKTASDGLATFSFSASANSTRQVLETELLLDGSVIDFSNSQSASTQFTTSVYGIHELRAISTDDLGAKADADPYYVIIHPAGGKVYTFVPDSGDWSTGSNWLVLNGSQTGTPPGAKDLAIIGASTVTLSSDVSVFALALNGGTICGAHNLNVIGATLAGGALQDLTFNIDSHGICVLTGDKDVAMNGTLNNNGKLQLTGLGGFTGITTSGKAQGSAGSVGPNDFGSFLRGVINNIGKTLFPKRAASKQTTTVRGVQLQKPVIDTHFTNVGKLITNDGGSLITNDGGTRPAGKTAEAAATTNALVQTGGEIDLGTSDSLAQLTIVGDLVLNGGVLNGSGKIQGNLVNNGGYILPGHSAGTIAVTGNFMQGADGTLVIEDGGTDPSQYDQLVINGSATLGGNLHVKTIDGFTPGSADVFNPLAYSSVSGSFASVSANTQATPNAKGLLSSIDPSIANPPYGQPTNISTRMKVETQNNVLIGGFIVSGPSGSTKKVLIHGLGPSLSSAGLSGLLADPLLVFHYPDGSPITNDNWGDAPNKDQIPAGFEPKDPKESIVIADLPPGVYTAIVKGAHGETGIGMTEVYDIDGNTAVALTNVSTRGLVETGDSVMIGGFIVGGGEPATMLVKVDGPSLKNPPASLTGVLEDPTLELHDANGSVIANDNWRETQESDILATTMAPSDDKEPAVLATLTPGVYTAIVRGKNGTTGIAIVEAYQIK